MKSNIEIAHLLKKGISGDRLAIKSVYEDCVRDMLTTSYQILNNMQDAEDVFQESFLKSINKINSLKNWKSYRSWLKRIVINDSLQKIRSKIKWENVDNLEIPFEEEEDDWYKGISFEAINDSIMLLPNGCKQIVTLYLLEGFKHREIADFLNISISTSKSQYRYALHLLKTMLTKKHLQ